MKPHGCKGCFLQVAMSLHDSELAQPMKAAPVSLQVWRQSVPTKNHLLLPAICKNQCQYERQPLTAASGNENELASVAPPLLTGPRLFHFWSQSGFSLELVLRK